ncbi:RFX-type winged-helix domain-containing protein [Meloidogyne graminicola]|uniref:RFX-type winged-helix domain-containing protein n=1 Tax=Meloidogyne graminicola TaxID=189291 RepID=A0A8S9ZPI0_9BILA|nr:RFX-type winged-helix domain-containing protein [Meloidogyne graminicola]
MELPPFLAPCCTSFISSSTSSSSSLSSSSSNILPPVNMLGNVHLQSINNNKLTTINNQQCINNHVTIHSPSSSSQCPHPQHNNIPTNCWTIYNPQETEATNNEGFQPLPPPIQQTIQHVGLGGRGTTFSNNSCMINSSVRQKHSSSVSSNPSPLSISTVIVNAPCERIIGEEGITNEKLNLNGGYLIGTMEQQQQQQATLAAVSSTPITFHILTSNSTQQNNNEQQHNQQHLQDNYFSTRRRQQQILIQQQQTLEQQQQIIEASHYQQHHHQQQTIPLHHLTQQQQTSTPQTSNKAATTTNSLIPHNFILRKNVINNQQRKPQITENNQNFNGEKQQQIIIINENSEGKRGGIKNNNNKECRNGEQQQTNQNNIARAPPETLEWIRSNYEYVEGASLPRNILYMHYADHCRETGLTPVNPASFGKLIRLVFDQKLSTRRLGTRGHSKYHYNGICLKQNSPLWATMDPNDIERMLNGSQQPHKNNSQRSQKKQLNNNTQKQKRGIKEGGENREINNNNLNNFSSSAATSPCEEKESILELEQYQGEEQLNSPIIYSSTTTTTTNHSNNNNNFNTSSTFLLPPQINELIDIKEGGLKLPEIELPIFDEGILLSYGLSLGHVLKFFDDYREHCREILNCIKDFRLHSIERLWLSFWQKNYYSENNSENNKILGGGGGGRLINEDNNAEIGQMRGAPILDSNSLYRLLSLPEIQTFVQTFDIQFYQIILDFFFISPLRIPLESDLCNNLRHFGKNIEFWMENALGNNNNLIIPQIFKKLKLECISLLANSLTRLSSFAHLAITARNVLQDKEKVKNLYEDFNRVDFGVFHWQADWLCSSSSSNSLQQNNLNNNNFCNNSNSLAKDLVYQFRDHLSRYCSLEEWAEWLESIVDKSLNYSKYSNTSLQQISNRGKRFILSWNLHSSLLLKEITLHSSTSFGEFHLVRLVFDDYLLIVMERKLAKILGKLPIELMASEWLQMEKIKLTNKSTLITEKSFSPQQQLNNSPSIVIPLLPSKIEIKQDQTYYPTHLQQKQQQINNITTSNYSIVEKLPLPGPEPPLDMLNGNGEDDYQEEKFKINSSSQILISPQIKQKIKEINYILIEEEQNNKERKRNI